MNRTVLQFFLAGLVFWPLDGQADEPAPFPEFTFKRVKIPRPGAGNLINVQIDPAEQAARLAVPKDAPAAGALPDTVVPGADAFAWFWDQLSPSLAASNPGRLDQAVRQVRDAGAANGIIAPRLQMMQSMAEKFGKDILLATVGTRVSPALVLAVMAVESGGRIDAVSPAGARGLMQLIPATAERFGVKDSADAAENIRGGVAYLDWLMGTFDSDPLFVLAAYNAGENAVKNNGGVPMFAETRAYVPKVLAAWTVAQGLCLTPPQLVSDGCVFAVQAVQKTNE